MSKPVMEDLFTFSGRRNRKSYIMCIIAMVFVIVIGFGISMALTAVAPIVGFIVGIVVMVPAVICGLAVGAQRCRDFGWTGWAVLLTMVPFVGFIAAIAFMVVPGTAGDNRYGADWLGGSST